LLARSGRRSASCRRAQTPSLRSGPVVRLLLRPRWQAVTPLASHHPLPHRALLELCPACGGKVCAVFKFTGGRGVRVVPCTQCGRTVLSSRCDLVLAPVKAAMTPTPPKALGEKQPVPRVVTVVEGPSTRKVAFASPASAAATRSLVPGTIRSSLGAHPCAAYQATWGFSCCGVACCHALVVRQRACVPKP
jgi:hypothetical protein